jgi:hypothetical protein
MSHFASAFQNLPCLLRGEVETVQSWLRQAQTRLVLGHLVLIVAGTALFGAAVGLWRAPLQALYTALKLPLILLATAFGNALLNGMLAPLLGLKLGFRQSFLAMVMSFASAAAILGAFSPLLLFQVWNTPQFMAGGTPHGGGYDLLLLTQAAAIAFAGVAAHVRLLQWLRHISRSGPVAGRVLLAWLAGNLLLGSQLSWILRPFVGTPRLPVQFLRTDALEGNFFEAILRTAERLM